MYVAFVGWLTFWMTYWVFGGLFPFDKKALLIRPSKSVPLIVFRNMIISLPYSLILWNVIPDFSDYIWDSVVLRFIISLALLEFWFYIAHRLLHTKLLYRWHKQHHEFKTPYPLVAVYCSPVEAILCDVSSFALGPSFLKMTEYEIMVWMFLSSIHVLLLHSKLSHGRQHGMHHEKFVGNYGVFTLCDRIFGTYN